MNRITDLEKFELIEYLRKFSSKLEQSQLPTVSGYAVIVKKQTGKEFSENAVRNWLNTFKIPYAKNKRKTTKPNNDDILTIAKAFNRLCVDLGCNPDPAIQEIISKLENKDD